ncbi:AAA family ATPase [Streptococcus dysgalactiae]|uniref:AAA family ATPase n=1 Tax=Streptococcus dysgalactiae subsp. dysgalactiae TaxID=99822 RepID=A0A9X7RXS0_STRDY|nr:AAA family ATPase [Streptococcus dysgalactiae]QGH02377.1 AAA family ATPase [Streptococcus dysgalactiae subsp. dysgalactiae]
MKEQNQFDWVDFYQEFAMKLLGFKDRRDDLVNKVRDIYTTSGIEMPKLEKDNQLVDIDPFTVFGLFNKKISNENRIKILQTIAKLFEIKVKVPSSFDSLPVLDNRNSTYYNFIGERGENDINELWKLFEIALAYAAEPSTENRNSFFKFFDLAINKKGNARAKITMALFWIAPSKFLNLDSRNEWYIYESGKLPVALVNELPKAENKISAHKYFLIVEKILEFLQTSQSELKDFKSLSYEAWRVSEQVNKDKTKHDSIPTGNTESLKNTSVELVEEEKLVGRHYSEYTENDFLSEVFLTKDEYDKLTGILRTKKNIILQGAPGVGKTFVATRLAYSMMGIKDIEKVMMVQFHQSYSYEDFIMGFRPFENGFELKKGVFYNFCKKAENDLHNDYFLIIDEINRGNLSKIFGELFMLIENDKRGISLRLLYSDELFSVPKNLHIIGMMNTADRSLAMLDYALRRRFAFFEIKPAFENDGFRKYRMGLENEKLDKLVACVESLNNVISNDETLGDGFCIGHSYFSNLSPKSVDDQMLSGIVEYELIPLLKEYWFDEPKMIEQWSGNLRSAIK